MDDITMDSALGVIGGTDRRVQATDDDYASPSRRMSINLDEKTTFQIRLRHCAKRAGGLNELSRLTDVSTFRLRQYIGKGSSELNRMELKRIARAANVRVGWLLDGELPIEPDALPEPLKDDEAKILIELQREGLVTSPIRWLVVTKVYLDQLVHESAVRAFLVAQEVPGCMSPGDFAVVAVENKVELSGIYLLEAGQNLLFTRFIVDPILGKITMIGDHGNTELSEMELAKLSVLGRVAEVWPKPILTEGLVQRSVAR